MTDPRTMSGQPSPEEMRAVLDQLREVEPAVLIAEAFNMLAQGAQVKLGRPDARPLIDALGGMVRATVGALPSDLATQMEQAIGQLQVAQVQAEAEASAPAGATGQQSSGAGGAAEGAPSAGAPSAPPGPSSQPPPANQRMTDRLWVPGRDPRPPGQ